MEGDRKNYVMSVEFAMQREMAYREKLKAQGITNNNSSQNPLHLQVVSQLPTPEQAPMPVQNSSMCLTMRPTTNPSPRPYFGSNQMQSGKQRLLGPTSSSTPLLRSPSFQGPRSLPAQNSSMSLTVRPPFNPSPRLMQSPQKRPLGPTRSSTPSFRPPTFQGTRSKPGASASHHGHQKRKRPHQPPQPGDYYCNLCQVDCCSEFNLRTHLKGHKHKSMLRNANNQNVSVGTSQITKEQKFCELCKVWCTDESSFKLHLNGKNHILRLHAADKKMML